MAFSTTRLRLAGLASVLLTLALAGCSVIGSEPPADAYARGDDILPQCRSSLGSYTLPKHVLRFVVTKKDGDPYHVLQKIDHTPVPDNNHVFCLDHLRSAFASDDVRVFKTKILKVQPDKKDTGGQPAPAEAKPEHTPYLQLVASKAVDHTAGIVRNFIKTAFILITNNGAVARSAIGGMDETQKDAVVVADFQVDPFDYREMARLNFTTRPMGFCFVLEDYTFNRDAAVQAANAYCNAPLAFARSHPPKTAKAISEMHYFERKPVSGIFFRPRASYRLTVYVKGDPEGPGQWKAGLIKSYEFENIMPIVSVGVDRAMFATRRTGLVFDDGLLKNVCISKGSELAGAIEIPLDIIYGLIAAPSAALMAASNASVTEKQLIERRQQLITAQNQYIAYLTQPGAKAPEIAATSKPAALTLGKNNAVTASIADVPTNVPDAGEILGTDTLNDICAGLKTSDSGIVARTF